MPDSSMLPARRRTLLIATSLLTLIIAAALLIHSHRQLQALEDRHIELIGQSLSRQLAQSSLPLVLSQDWVSLNYSLQQASEDVHIAGARIADAQGKVLAQVGQSNDYRFRQPLASGEQQLAELSLFLDRQALAQSLVKQRNSVPAAILLGLATLLLGYWLTLRWLDKRPPKPIHTGAKPDSPDYSGSYLQSAHAKSPDLHSSDLQSSDLKSSDLNSPDPKNSYLHSAYNPNPADDNSGRQAQAQATTDLQAEAEITSEFKFRPDPGLLDEVAGDWHQANDEIHEEQETDLLAEPLNADVSAPAFEPESELTAEDTGAAEPPTAATESPRMADPFARFAADYSPGNEPDNTPESAPATGPSPQLTAVLGQYLLYVDHRSAGHHLEDEKAALLPHYLQFFQLASQLYKGEQREDAQGNWYALFTWDTSTADEQVPAGVSALCAAQLFKSLYRQFNQSRIQSLQPVLNLKMALLGGDDELTLALHAHQLTAMLESNELISHEAVFAQPELFQRLLQEGDYSRQDQDTYLIHQLAAGFQNLIDRQATHFLHQKQAQPD